jgi:hypothetical protein
MQWLRHLRPEGEAWTYDRLIDASASGPVLIAEAVEELGLQPVAWTVEISERATSSVNQRERAGGFPPSSTGRARQATERAFLMLLLSIYRGQSEAPKAGLSAELLEIIRADVRHGIALDALMNRVWSVHTTAKDILVEALRDVVSAEDLAFTMRRISDAAFDFANDFVRRVSVAYETEQRAWRSRRSEEQFQIVRAVISGEGPHESDDAVLPAQWSGKHVCAVAWLHGAGFVRNVEGQIGDWAAEVARALGAAHVFVFERDGLTRIWWNIEANADAPDVHAIAGFERPKWLRLAVGHPGVGVDGFRHSHLSAAQAARVRAFETEREIFFASEIGHLVLMLADPREAAQFVTRELGGLADDEPRLAEIRETVRLYLLSGNSRLTVASVLHLAPNTIAYRVGQANELLASSVSERATPVLLALELLELVPSLLRTFADA